MTAPTSRAMEIFLDLFESLPRQGPGSRACAERAMALCTDLTATPDILDLGCGTGAQTLYLAELTAGTIVAIDSHAPSVERLERTVVEHGLAERVRPMVADMRRLPLSPESFDLIWSEGALYNVGIEEGLAVCRRLLRPGGYIVFTEPVWAKADPPPEVRAAFADYPTMGWASDVVASIEQSGLSFVDHFTLPDEAWWDDFYGPMERRIAELRAEHAGDAEALAALDEIAREPEMHRAHSSYYGYEMFVVRRP